MTRRAHPARVKCRICRTRYRQIRGSYCRQCWRAAGCPIPTLSETVVRVERQRSPIRPVSVHGIDGWVVWDGTCQVSIHEAVR